MLLSLSSETHLHFNRFLIKWKTYKESLQMFIIIDFFQAINLTLYFLSALSGRNFVAFLSWILLVPMYPLSKLETSPCLTSVVSQDIALHHGVTAANSICRSLVVFNKHTISLCLIVLNSWP